MQSAENKYFLRFILAAIVFCTLYTLLQFTQACLHHNKDACQPAEDFIAFYTVGKNALARNAKAVYDADAARAMLDRYSDHAKAFFLPLLYPPHSLIFLSVLGFFSYNAAFLVWYFLPLLLFIKCLGSDYVQKLLPDVSALEKTIIVFPFLMIAFLAGQNGMLWASLFILILSLRNARPVFTGILLSLFFKPHLGIFLPLLLLYEKNWKALISAIISTLILMALATFIWGISAWHYYTDMLQVFGKIEYITPLDYIFPAASPFMGFRMLGINTDTAFVCQFAIALAVLITVWKTLRYCTNDAQIALFLAIGGLLFSTYSYIYDDIMLVLPCLILFARAKTTTSTPSQRMALILMAFIPIVAIKLHHMYIPYAFFSISFAFITLVMSILRKKNAVIPA